MSDNIVSLHKAAVQEDIVQGLRNLADKLEQEGPEAYDMPAITTVVCVLGHGESKPLADGEIERSTWFEHFSWGVRSDAFTVRGLLVTVLKQ